MEFKTPKRGSIDVFQDRGRMNALQSNLRVMLTREPLVNSPTRVWDARSANSLLESESVGMAGGCSFSRQLLHSKNLSSFASAARKHSSPESIAWHANNNPETAAIICLGVTGAI